MNAAKPPSTLRNMLWGVLLTVLGIACFPANPLVLTGVLDVETYPVTTIIGWVVWAFGMVLVLAPMLYFPSRGGVPKGKSFVYTTRLVDTGIYAVVRHSQYTGGIYALFLANALFYPHWLFIVLGVIGIIVIVVSCREEDKLLIEKFGPAYADYIEKVPGINIFSGILRLIRSK